MRCDAISPPSGPSPYPITDGPTPYGLTYDRASGEWSFNEAEAAVVREIFHRVAAGDTCEAIARDFDDRGIKRKRAPGWIRERVWNLVTSPTYKGQWIANKAMRQSMTVPAVVTSVEWHAAQSALESHGKRGLRRTQHVYLLEAVGRCGVCGGSICISSASKAARRPAYYTCHARLRPAYGAVRCTLPMMLVADVDARVWAAMRDLLATPGQLELAIEHRNAQATLDARDWRKDLEEARKRLEHRPV